VNNNKEILESLTESISNYQIYYIYLLLEYLKITKNMQITKYEINIFKQCSELVLRLTEYCQQGELPLWIYYLEKLIFTTDININISLEAADFILDLISSTFGNSEIFRIIKYYFYYIELPNSVIDDDVLQLINQKTGARNTCYELLMGKLYLLLLEQNNQRKVVDLIVKISKLDKQNFEYLVLNTISSNNFNSIVEGVKLFSEFWKLVNEAYPDLVFFDSGECILKMIEYLDNKNPFLRHLSKTWLNQVNQSFNKILDPIISIFLLIICIAYDLIIIFGQIENTFKLDIFAGKVLRWFFQNVYLISPIRLFPIYFTFFVVAYSFGNINSDISFCVFFPYQTEPCHMLLFVGMLAKFICPLCYNFIELMYNGVNLKGNNSKIALYFEEQFGYLNSDNIVIFVVKILVLLLFLKAFCSTATKCYGNFAYKKSQYLTFHSNYENKESEILMGELLLLSMHFLLFLILLFLPILYLEILLLMLMIIAFEVYLLLFLNLIHLLLFLPSFYILLHFSLIHIFFSRMFLYYICLDLFFLVLLKTLLHDPTF